MIRFHDEASAEAEQAAVHYSEINPELGYRFVATLRDAMRQIEANPDRFPIDSRSPRDLRGRSLTLGPFPYSVIYVQHAAELVILAVAHHHRRPGYWRSRKP